MINGIESTFFTGHSVTSHGSVSHPLRCRSARACCLAAHKRLIIPGVSSRPFFVKPLKSRITVLITGLVLLIAVGGYFLLSRVLSTISHEKERLESARSVKVELLSRRALDQNGIAYYGYLQEVRAVESFAGAHYVATSGGLVAFDEQGRMTSHYTTLDGLPDNDLTALATSQERLYIGTNSQGLVSYDGRTFSQYRLIQPKAAQVTALAATEDRLLIGMLDGGLFEYDGQQFRQSQSSSGGTEPKKVTVLFSRYPEIYAGTFDQGLFVWHEGRWDQLTTKEGLPSNRVTAIIEDADGILIGTDLGIARLNGGSTTPIAQIGNVTSLAQFQDTVYAGLFTGQIVQINASKERPSRTQHSQLALPNNAANVILRVAEDRLWAMTSRGIYVSPSPGAEPFKRFDQPTGDLQLSASHISTLATDWRGRLWIGYFDRGIDVIDPNQPRLITHLEDEVIREINFLQADADGQRMLAATSGGFVVIDQLMRQQRYTERDGLISNSVSHLTRVPASIVLPRPDERPRPGEAFVLATGRGLSIYAENIFRSLNAFHGLASNHLYTSARVGDRLFVGSLNGLNELEGLRVVRTFQTSNSKLSHNWVSALVTVGSTLYIGTYGGGVDALLPSGELINFASLIGKFSVNPNALHFDGERLYVGTLEQGVWILAVQQDTWSHFTQGLGSSNVTAITSDGRAIYYGTDRGLTRVSR